MYLSRNENCPFLLNKNTSKYKNNFKLGKEALNCYVLSLAFTTNNIKDFFFLSKNINLINFLCCGTIGPIYNLFVEL